MSLRKILLEFNVTDQKNILQNILYRVGAEVEDVDYSKSGAYGDVFKVKGKDKIIKLTTSEEEIDTLQKLKRKKFEYVVNIYFSLPIPESIKQEFELSNTHMDIHLMVMEELEPIGLSYSTPISVFLRELSKNVYDGVRDSRTNTGFMTYLKALDKKLSEELDDNNVEEVMVVLDMLGNQLNREEFKLVLDAFLNIIIDNHIRPDRFHDEITKLKTLDENFIPDIIKGLQELKSLDIYNSDIHLGNVMLDPKSGNYKLIDVQ